MWYIAFNKRSSVTAKALQSFLTEKGEKVRMINDKRFKFIPSVLIRWGNSYLPAPDGCVEINSIESVKLASNKLLMAYTLIRAGVKFPKAYAGPTSISTIGRHFGLINENGAYEVGGFNPMENGLNLYYRNGAGIVRKRDYVISSDLYGTEPIDRAREFRVHVFNGKTIGVYEKIPMEENQLYCKNENCDFRRVDVSVKESRDLIKGVRPEAKKAVEALGLLFGGVDVILSKGGEVFVNEVNSAPALNGPNLDRYYEAITEYLNVKKEVGQKEQE